MFVEISIALLILSNLVQSLSLSKLSDRVKDAQCEIRELKLNRAVLFEETEALANRLPSKTPDGNSNVPQAPKTESVPPAYPDLYPPYV